MAIKAILRDGRIQPLEPLPRDWAEGQELVVVEPVGTAATANGSGNGSGIGSVTGTVNGSVPLDEWARELEAAAARVPAAEHDLFRQALSDIERESKEAVRREWGLS